MGKKYSTINISRCVACGECVNACPRDAVNIQKGCYAVVDAEGCAGCGLCEMYCPTGAIVMQDRENVKESREGK